MIYADEEKECLSRATAKNESSSPSDNLQMPDLNKENFKHTDLTDPIIQAFYKVYNALGNGFLEKVYENAMFHELTAMGIDVKRQHPIKVAYEGIEVGSYYPDLILSGLVIVELKAAESYVQSMNVNW